MSFYKMSKVTRVGIITLYYIDLAKNIANILTKPLEVDL